MLNTNRCWLVSFSFYCKTRLFCLLVFKNNVSVHSTIPSLFTLRKPSPPTRSPTGSSTRCTLCCKKSFLRRSRTLFSAPSFLEWSPPRSICPTWSRVPFRCWPQDARTRWRSHNSRSRVSWPPLSSASFLPAEVGPTFLASTSTRENFTLSAGCRRHFT